MILWQLGRWFQTILNWTVEDMGRAQLSLRLLLERYSMSWKVSKQNMVRNALEEMRSQD